MEEQLLESENDFSSLDVEIDNRFIKALDRAGFSKPTIVQSKCIPLALNGKDMLVRARTGSGKTLAYILPLLQKILKNKTNAKPASRKRKAVSSSSSNLVSNKSIKAIILVPTRELCSQVYSQINDMMYYCKDVVSLICLGNESIQVQYKWLTNAPDIVITTPGRLVNFLTIDEDNMKPIDLKSHGGVETFIVDEADLIFSYGYENDIKTIVNCLPNIYQSFLMSATLNDDIKALKKIVLHNPAIIKLEDGETDGKLNQWYLSINQDDKDIILYALLKLNLINGKTIFFVNSVTKCYRLKLLLEQFSVKSAVLNAELPVNSRQHILEEFNKGIFDFLIATDESLDMASGLKKKDSEYGVSRGVDFKNVSTVINVDFPVSAESYTHRIGRTARGGNTGTALSLVDYSKVDEVKVLEQIQQSQPALPSTSLEGQPVELQQPSLLALDVKELEGFRYRVEAVSRAVTTKAIAEARQAELKQELINSDRLQSHFEDNPKDLQILQHDATLRPNKIHKAIGVIPKYLMPSMMQQADALSAATKNAGKNRLNKKVRGSGEDVGYGKSTSGRQQWKLRHQANKKRNARKKRKRKDALF